MTHLYRALLLLYPKAFREKFGDEMACDFEEATSEAWAARGWIGVLTLVALVAADLMRTAVSQWLRTGWPAALALSGTLTAAYSVLIAHQVPHGTDVSRLLPARTADEEMRVMMFGAVVVVLLIAATILITAWFWMFAVRRQSRA